MRIINKFQQGGQIDPATGAPVEGAPMEGQPAGGQDEMMQQLAQIANELINQLGPEAAMALAQMIIEMLQGGAQEAPMFKKGGKLVKKSCKMACGGKSPKMKKK